uniref:hypothetical protein n=1 Tax=Anaerostipes caccae TaxID=105841 RepID=UPI003AB675B0
MLRKIKRAAACAMSAVLLSAGTLAPVKAASWTAPPADRMAGAFQRQCKSPVCSRE